GDLRDERLVALAEGQRGLQGDGGAEAGLLAFQGDFDASQRIAVAAVQVGAGGLAVVEQLALGIVDARGDGDDGVFLDLHGEVSWGRGRQRAGRWAFFGRQPLTTSSWVSR